MAQRITGIIAATLLLSLFFWLMIEVGSTRTRQQIYREAKEAGAGEWFLDENDQRQWRWINETPTSQKDNEPLR